MDPITKEHLLKIRLCNWEGRYFFPYQQLRFAVSRDSITATLAQNLLIPKHRLIDIAQRVSTEAWKVLAILILVDQGQEIVRFIESGDVDSRLPIATTPLAKLMPTTNDQFLQWQWEFIAPIFSRSSNEFHLRLQDYTILPFIENNSLEGAEGGFGQVFEVAMDAGHQEIVNYIELKGTQHVRIARKQLTDTGFTAEAMLKKEVATLEMLRNLMHPNILELYCSYTLDGIHNMLFPLAEMNIKQWMQLDLVRGQPPCFHTSHNMVICIQGLASALDSLHNFVYRTPELELGMIGYHHDLKPANVLIRNGAFLIADFGLSRVKGIDQGSATRWKGGTETYGAPECQNAQTFQRLEIGRGADIWSLGCILTEIVIYLCRGPLAVKDFAQERITIHRTPFEFTEDSFHENGALKPKIQSWYKVHITESALLDPELEGIAKLAPCLLIADPSERPTARNVLEECCVLSLRAQLSRTIKCYCTAIHALGEEPESTLGLNGDIKTHLDVELKRFKAIGQVLGVYSVEEYLLAPTNLAQLIYSRISRCCEGIDKALGQLQVIAHSGAHNEDGGQALHRFLSKVGYLNDDLRSYLPKKDREIADEIWANNSISTENLSELSAVEGISRTDPRYQTLTARAVSKSMSVMITRSRKLGGKSLLIEKELVEIDQPLDSLNTGNLVSYESPGSQRNILIEWKRYDSSWQGSQSEVLFNRVEDLAQLLQSFGQKLCPQALECMGYIHQAADLRFGFVYSFPEALVRRTCRPKQPISLARVITNNLANPKIPGPLLGDVFRLANYISHALSTLHQVSWLHKGISSHNIVFFTQEKSSHHPPIIDSPFLVGFSHSRPDDNQVFTQPPPERNFYQHPDYASDKSRFDRSYDLYSLGIVLLEIGLWRTLASFGTRYKDMTPWEFHGKLVRDIVPQLGEHVGASYRNAVSLCLGPAIKEESMVKKTVLWENVLGKLSALHA